MRCYLCQRKHQLLAGSSQCLSRSHAIDAIKPRNTQLLPLATRLQHLDIAALLLKISPSPQLLPSTITFNLSPDVAHARAPVKHDLFAREQLVDLLKGELPGFGVKEVDEGQEEEVEDAEVDVGSISDVVDANGGNFDDEEGEDP